MAKAPSQDKPARKAVRKTAAKQHQGALSGQPDTAANRPAPPQMGTEIGPETGPGQQMGGGSQIFTDWAAI